MRAAEQDDPARPEIDAVVVSEPQVQPEKSGGDFVIVYGDTIFADHSRGLLDIATLMDVYAPSAAYVVDPTDRTSADQQRRARRSALLRARGLLAADDAASQGHEALAMIHAAGMLPDADALLPFHEAAGLWRALAMTYANAYGRASVSCSRLRRQRGRRRCPGHPEARERRARRPDVRVERPRLLLANRKRQLRRCPAAERFQPRRRAVLPLYSSPARTISGQTAVGPSWLDAARVRAGIAEVRATGKLGAANDSSCTAAATHSSHQTTARGHITR